MISIIIPAYNEEKYIGRTLKSIKSQDFKDYEVIVICNGCTDNTYLISKKYTKKTFNLKERGIANAQNYGAGKSNGDLLLFLDADVILNDKNTLSHIKDYKLGTCKIKPIEKKLKFKIYTLMKNYLSRSFGSKNGMLFCSKKIFNEIGGFDPEKQPKENFPFIKSAKRQARFIAVNPYVRISMRRYNQQGFLKTAWFWIKINLSRKRIRYGSFR